ncbi:hypothetical protein D9Q98_010021 [Chlorella vulgaris]|uniref:ATP-dependent Clp protease proteolytic subunit n=1 Tax=Chlorella vulgaris TaxID=3077 RepID=A0A9D4TFV6_CHLVU|nr:hypothetical protein D9Q98_010021 [Chlorella vulgaris]
MQTAARPAVAAPTASRCSRPAARRAVQVAASARNPSNLWTPTSQRSVEFGNSAPENVIYAGQGPPPPSPMVVERFQQVISQLFQQRIVRLGGPVDDDMANLIVAQLLYLDAADPNKDVTLYVNSPGGSVTAGMAVFDTMRHIRPNVSTVCVGLAASMGAFLLASGHQGKRYSLPNSRIMIHQPLGGAQGQAADIEIQANEILHHKLTLNGYLAEFTGQGMETITADTDRDFFMSAQEAVEYGLIDAVVSKPALMMA